MSEQLTTRPISIIEHRDPAIEALHPQNTVIVGDHKVSNGKRYLDIGALCYRQRKKRSINRHGEYQGMYVMPSSIDTDRIAVIGKIIETVRLQKNFISSVGFHARVKCFFDWIDAQTEDYDFSNAASWRRAYIEYTKNLLARVNASGIRGEPLSIDSAAVLQVSARQVLTYATEMHEREVALLATLISQTDRQTHINLKQLSGDTQARTFATLIKFIDESHRILVEGGDFPMQLMSPGCENYFLYSLHQNTTKTKNANFSLANFLSTCPCFPEWDKVAEHFSIHDENYLYRLNYLTFKKRYTQNNVDKRSDFRLQVANHAMTAGMLAFIAATACNLSVAQELETANTDFLPSTQGQRFYGVKPRAIGKSVAPEFGARFTPTFRKIIDIRNWLVEGQKSPRIFVVIPKGTNTIGHIGTGAIHSLKRTMQKYYPSIAWVPATQWRKNVSYAYINKSGGDTALTAEKLSNTEKTVAKKYARPAVDELAVQMTNLLDAIHSTAIARTRNTEHVLVRIISEIRQKETIGVGDCVKRSELAPRRAAGFTEHAPQPSCREPETCLFCDFYAVHADESDIRRLLSLRYVIMASRPDIDHERWTQKVTPTIHRIDEVLTAVSKADSGMSSLISKVGEEIKAGHMDQFWAIHFDTLVHIGAVV